MRLSSVHTFIYTSYVYFLYLMLYRMLAKCVIISAQQFMVNDTLATKQPALQLLKSKYGVCSHN